MLNKLKKGGGIDKGGRRETEKEREGGRLRGGGEGGREREVETLGQDS